MPDDQDPFATLRESIRSVGDTVDDPFEAFNAAQGMGTVRDPYSIFAAMRAAAPVHHVDLEAMGGGASRIWPSPTAGTCAWVNTSRAWRRGYCSRF